MNRFISSVRYLDHRINLRPQIKIVQSFHLEEIFYFYLVQTFQSFAEMLFSLAKKGISKNSTTTLPPLKSF